MTTRDSFEAIVSELGSICASVQAVKGNWIDSDGDLRAKDGTVLATAGEIDEVFALLAAWVGKN